MLPSLVTPDGFWNQETTRKDPPPDVVCYHYSPVPAVPAICGKSLQAMLDETCRGRKSAMATTLEDFFFSKRDIPLCHECVSALLGAWLLAIELAP